MHPLLHEMGRKIVRDFEIGKNSRRCIEEEAEYVLLSDNRVRTFFTYDFETCLGNIFLCNPFGILCSFHQRTEAIEGYCLKLCSARRDCFEQLAVNSEYLSPKLRWISLHGFSSEYLHNFYLHDVVAIDLKRSLLRLVWKEPQVLLRPFFY